MLRGGTGRGAGMATSDAWRAGVTPEDAEVTAGEGRLPPAVAGRYNSPSRVSPLPSPWAVCQVETQDGSSRYR